MTPEQCYLEALVDVERGRAVCIVPALDEDGDMRLVERWVVPDEEDTACMHEASPMLRAGYALGLCINAHRAVSEHSGLRVMPWV